MQNPHVQKVKVGIFNRKDYEFKYLEIYLIHRFSFSLLADFYLKKETYHLIGGLVGVLSTRNSSEIIVTRLGNGDVHYGSGPDTTKVHSKSLAGTLGFGRKFCFQQPHPAFLVRILSHYVFSSKKFLLSEKGRNNISFVLEVGYEF